MKWNDRSNNDYGYRVAVKFRCYNNSYNNNNADKRELVKSIKILVCTYHLC